MAVVVSKIEQIQVISFFQNPYNSNTK